MRTTTDITDFVDELDIELSILDLAVHAERQPLPIADIEPGPAVYLTFYVGSLAMYERVGDASWPLAVGSSVDGRDRMARHRRNAKPIASLHGGADLFVLSVTVPSHAFALFAESLLISRLNTLYNTPMFAGWGSRWQGRSRRTQAPPPFSIAHPGRPVGSGETTVTAAFLRRKAAEHLAATARPLWPAIT